VTGIFSMTTTNTIGLALIHSRRAEALRIGDAVSGVRLKLKDLFQSHESRAICSRACGGELYISDWTRSNANYFRAVQIEKP